MSNQIPVSRPLPSLLDDDTFGFPEMLPGVLNWPSALNTSLLRNTGLPAVNIKELPKSFEIELAVPGYRKEDLQVNVKDGLLIVSAERKKEKEEEKNGYSRMEFSCRSFDRSFRLPENTDGDNVKATHAHGVLHLSIPKTKNLAEKTGRTIRID